MIEQSFSDSFWEFAFSWSSLWVFGGALLIVIVGLVLLRKTPRARTHRTRRRTLKAIITLGGTVITLGIIMVLYVIQALHSFKAGP